nr:signal peptidase I [Streptomyces specialis]
MGERGRSRAASRHGVPRDQAEQTQEPHGSEPRPTLRGPGEGRAARRRAAKRIKRRRRLRATREVPILIGTALLIALILKTFLVQAFVIPSGSMEQTIKIDDRVLVDKLTPWFGWEPARGEVVVFKDPGGWLQSERENTADDEAPIVIEQIQDALTWIGLLPTQNDQDLIKRVIGIGGDRVVCCDDEGRVTVNGEPLNEEDYIYPGNPPSLRTFDVTVPEGRLFVMGDHRSNSSDSRYHLDEAGQGTVPEDLVVGRAVVIAWPFGHWGKLDGTEAFASVPDPETGTVGARSTADPEEFARLPMPAELPLVMGVAGLSRARNRPERSVRSECGGCSGGCAGRLGRSGGASGATGWRRVRRGIPRCADRLRWRRRGRRPGR